MKLFIGIDFPKTFKEEFSSRVQGAKLRTPERDLRLPFPGDLHLTLVYIGEVEPTQVAPIRALMEKESQNTEPFSFKVDAIGAFPSAEEARIFWAGFQTPPEALTELVSRLKHSLKSEGFQYDDQPFVPHLTVARSREPIPLESIRADLEKITAPSLLEAQVRTLTLFETLPLPPKTQARMPRAGGRYQIKETVLLSRSFRSIEPRDE